MEFLLNLCRVLLIPQLCLALGLAPHSAGLGSAPFRPGTSAVTTTAPVQQADAPFAIGDFDGDRRPDLATIQSLSVSSLRTRYWISFRLSAGRDRAVSVTAPSGGIAIFARDVNNDHILDLVLVTAWRHQPVAILLNDGAGNFTAADPARFPADVSRSNATFLPTTPRVEDRTVLLAARFSRKDCRGYKRLSPTPQQSAGSLGRVSFVACTLLPGSALFGRAPPNITLFV